MPKEKPSENQGKNVASDKEYKGQSTHIQLETSLDRAALSVLRLPIIVRFTSSDSRSLWDEPLAV